MAERTEVQRSVGYVGTSTEASSAGWTGVRSRPRLRLPKLGFDLVKTAQYTLMATTC